MEVRVARPGDAEAVAAIYAPIVALTAISFETEPPGADEMRRRIRRTLRCYPWLVAVESDRIAGYAYAHAFATRPAYAWSVETSVYVHPEHRRSGVGRSLYGVLFDLLRRQGICRAVAGIALPNPASVRLHEAMGFRPVGVYRRVGWKLGKWWDVGRWELDLAPKTASPTPPVPFRRLRLGAAVRPAPPPAEGEAG